MPVHLQTSETYNKDYSTLLASPRLLGMPALVSFAMEVVIIYGILSSADSPSRALKSAAERKYLAFAYIFTVFFLVPAILLGITALT